MEENKDLENNQKNVSLNLENNDENKINQEVNQNSKGGRVEKIFSILTFVVAGITLIACLSTVLLPIFYAITMLVLLFACLIMTIFTLGLIYAFPNNPASIVWGWIVSMGDASFIEVIIQFCVSLIPYLCIAGIVLGAISIILNLLKKKKSVLRFVFVCIVTILLIVGLMLFFVVGGTL